MFAVLFRWFACLSFARTGIPLRRGLFITTSTYVPRARTIGVRTIDGSELVAWERNAKWLLAGRAIVSALVVGVPLALLAQELAATEAAGADATHVTAQQQWQRLCTASQRLWAKALKTVDALCTAACHERRQ